MKVVTKPSSRFGGVFVLALLGLFKILKLVWFGIQLCKMEKKKKT